MARYEVSDELLVRIEPPLPVRARRARWPGRLPMDDRACVNGIMFVLLTGISWVDLPQQFQPSERSPGGRRETSCAAGDPQLGVHSILPPGDGHPGAYEPPESG